MTDGRNTRAERTRAAIMAACRDAMHNGIFQPTVTDVAKAAEISVRSVFQHYSSVENMRMEALTQPHTFWNVADAIMGGSAWQGTPVSSVRRIVMAAVLGRVGG